MTGMASISSILTRTAYPSITALKTTMVSISSQVQKRTAYSTTSVLTTITAFI